MTVQDDAGTYRAGPEPEASRYRLSVVVPTYNRRDMTLRAIDSVLDQDPKRRVQVIAVDDGSTDATSAALHERYSLDARVRIITTPHNHASAARNVGFQAATGELVCFLDSDDYWLPQVLATVEHVFARYPRLAFLSIDGSTLAASNRAALNHIVAGDSPGWSHAGFRDAPLTSEPWPPEAAETVLLRGDFFPAIIHGDLFYLSGLVIRRDIVAAAGPFTERFRYFNDWEFFVRMCLQGVGAYLDFDGFRRDSGRDDQISRNRPISAMARRHLYIMRSLRRRFPDRISKYAKSCETALDDAHYGMGRCLMRTEHWRWSRRYLLHCLNRRYKFWRSLVLLASSWRWRGPAK